jgi:hypothetical protein
MVDRLRLQVVVQQEQLIEVVVVEVELNLLVNHLDMLEAQVLL